MPPLPPDQLLAGTKLNHEFFRYFTASAVALIVDYSTLAYLTEVHHLHYLLSASLAFCGGIAVIYLASIFWVFSYRKFQNPVTELSIFVIIGLLGLLVNMLLMWLATEWLEFHYLLSKLFSAGFVFCCNFIARRLLLFYKVEKLTSRNPIPHDYQ